MTDTALLQSWLRRSWRGHRRSLVGLLVGSALVAVGHAAFTGLWKWVLDDAAAGSALGSGVALLVLAVAQSILYVFVQGTRTRMNHEIQRRTRDEVFAHIAQMGPERLRAWRVGDLLTRLVDDISDDKLAWFMCSGVFRAYEAGMVTIA